MKNPKPTTPIYLSRSELKTCGKKELINQVKAFQETVDWLQSDEHPLAVSAERMFLNVAFLLAQRDTLKFALIANLGKEKASEIISSLDEFTLERYKTLIDPCGPDLPYPQLPKLEESEDA